MCYLFYFLSPFWFLIHFFVFLSFKGVNIARQQTLSMGLGPQDRKTSFAYECKWHESLVNLTAQESKRKQKSLRSSLLLAMFFCLF